MIGFKDVRVDSINKDGVYIRMVRSALAYSFANEFQYKVLDDARQILEARRDPLPIPGTAQLRGAGHSRQRRRAGAESGFLTHGEVKFNGIVVR